MTCATSQQADILVGKCTAVSHLPPCIALISYHPYSRAEINATNIAGHGVRAGMATQAALNGSSERVIARTIRHRSRRILRRYIRPGEMFRENASASLGL